VALRNNEVKDFYEYKLSEEKYKVLLPSNWSVEEVRENIDGKELELKFNSDKIDGKITILNNLNSINEIDEIMFKNANNKKYYGYENSVVSWNVIEYEVKENNNISKNKCYFRENNEGKVILINFKYNNSKCKPSMEVVFEEIVDNFR
jgi:rRNA maturation endonuclease Nob1